MVPRHHVVANVAGALADQAQATLASIRSDAERYIQVKLAAKILRDQIERYRQENQGPLVKRASQAPQPAAQPAPSFQARVGEEDEPRAPAEGREDDTTYDKPRRPRKASAYEDNLKDLREMAEEDPRMVVMIVRGWMNKHE